MILFYARFIPVSSAAYPSGQKWGGVHALGVSDYAELLSLALGVELTEEELMLIARRAINLEKAFNTLHTQFGREDDLPPRRYMEEPVKGGPYEGRKCDDTQFNDMLDKFYELQGWDRTTSLQTRKTLLELEMGDIAERLEKAGKLIL